MCGAYLLHVSHCRLPYAHHPDTATAHSRPPQEIAAHCQQRLVHIVYRQMPSHAHHIRAPRHHTHPRPLSAARHTSPAHHTMSANDDRHPHIIGHAIADCCPVYQKRLCLFCVHGAMSRHCLQIPHIRYAHHLAHLRPPSPSRSQCPLWRR